MSNLSKTDVESLGRIVGVKIDESLLGEVTKKLNEILTIVENLAPMEPTG